MGIYCIAAGSSSDNRAKTLDRSWSVADLLPYLSAHDVQRLREHFPGLVPIFLWGANRRGQLPRVRPGDYVIDFQDQRVAHVFRYCFFISTGSDLRLQHHVGWDQGARSTADRRPYPFVFFLKDPTQSHDRDKRFFLRAFGAQQKPHFFDGQKYLDDDTCAAALERAGLGSLEALLGLGAAFQPIPSGSPRATEAAPSPPPVVQPAPHVIEPPDWLLPVVDSVKRLWAQRHTLERDHEHAVAQFLEALGYRPGDEIRFQRSNIDIVLTQNGRALAVIEVKADRALDSTHRTVLGQAFGYALEAGAPVVMISNGNYYAVFDRRRGLSREECMIAEFRLLSLDGTALEVIATLRRGVIS